MGDYLWGHPGLNGFLGGKERMFSREGPNVVLPVIVHSKTRFSGSIQDTCLNFWQGRYARPFEPSQALVWLPALERKSSPVSGFPSFLEERPLTGI